MTLLLTRWSFCDTQVDAEGLFLPGSANLVTLTVLLVARFVKEYNTYLYAKIIKKRTYVLF
jgi:hypothetical protein